jgi:coenzyme PQQ synthesis protein D (PqqD)
VRTERSAGTAFSDTAHKGAELRPSPDVVAQRLGDEVVVVHLQTNQIFVLNRTGARFWELLGDGATVDELKEKILTEFEVEEGQLGNELEDFVAVLSKEKLIDVDKNH